MSHEDHALSFVRAQGTSTACGADDGFFVITSTRIIPVWFTTIIATSFKRLKQQRRTKYGPVACPGTWSRHR